MWTQKRNLDLEGPFGDHTGYYTLPEPYPKFRIERITHRRDRVYPEHDCRRPPMERFLYGTASVRIFLPVFQMSFNADRGHGVTREGVFP